MNIRIVTDSTCDLPPSITARNNITVIPMYINMGSRGYLDGVDLSRQEFYALLPQTIPSPTTAAPSPEVFRKTYERLAAQGADQILSIHVASSLSSTIEIAQTAAQTFSTIPVTVFDSRQLSLGMGFLVEKAAHMVKANYPLSEILAQLEDQISRTHVFAALETIEYLRRSGRINWALAGLTNFLHIRPIIKMYSGQPTTERIRTDKGAIRRLIKLLSINAPYEQVALVHSHAPEKAEILRQQVLNLLPGGEILSVDITPTIGAHLGTGAVGFACVSINHP
ncbi:MAG: DegV family protein [Chloroflexota bacterium]